MRDLSCDLSSEGNANSKSFMVDGSDIAKRKLAYEGKLFYYHTAPGSVWQVRLWSFISMKPYITKDTTNLFHVNLRCMLCFELNDIMTTEIRDMCP